jgi:ABC-2 type transport system ATP-binding protein
MKRRLMIARALVHEPKVLILDEPTAGVDIELRRSMWAFLQDINKQGTTIILTTHYLEEAEMLCRGIAIIDQGKIIEHTTIKELLSRLNTETVIFDLKHALSKAPLIPGCEIVIIEKKTMEITFSKALSLNDIFSALTKQHIEVVSMRNKTNRLEELFMHLVKKHG